MFLRPLVFQVWSGNLEEQLEGCWYAGGGLCHHLLSVGILIQLEGRTITIFAPFSVSADYVPKGQPIPPSCFFILK